MRAIRLSSPASVESNPLHPADLPIPEPRSGQVRIRIAACGVCHTDLHTVEGEIHPPCYPLTPGHQVVGYIDVVGADLAPAQWVTTKPVPVVGQRVGIPWLHSACGACDYCKRGEENLCPQARFTGFHTDGGYAEFMLADARYVLPIPEGISAVQAAPLLCAGIVGYRSLKKAEIRPGERVGLFGFGASAHLCLQVLRHWGCEVHVFTRSPAHQCHALELGAARATAAGEGESAQLDRAVIFAPAGELVLRALEQIRPGGTVAVNAIHMSDIPAFPYRAIYGERTLRSVANATYTDGQEFLALAAAAGVTSTVKEYALEDANRALQDLKVSRFNGEAVLVIG